MIFPERPSRLFLNNHPGPDIVIAREEGEDAHGKKIGPVIKVNVPWRVTWHSPDGFEVGYGGSGPADLALNILQDFLPGEQVDCYKGTKCSRWAAFFHQQFKTEFLEGMPKEGGTIPAEKIEAWISGKLKQIAGAHTTVLPREGT